MAEVDLQGSHWLYAISKAPCGASCSFVLSDGQIEDKKSAGYMVAYQVPTKIRRGLPGVSRFVLGEPGGTRTRDPVLKRHMLYHLSYRP